MPNIIVTGLSQWSLIFEILQANDQLIKVVIFVPLIPRGVKFKRSGPNCCAPFLHGKTEIAAKKKGDVILYGFGLRKFPSFYANWAKSIHHSNLRKSKAFKKYNQILIHVGRPSIYWTPKFLYFALLEREITRPISIFADWRNVFGFWKFLCLLLRTKRNE